MTGDLFDFLNVTETGRGSGAQERIQLDTGAFIFPGMALSRAPALLEAARHIVRQAPFRHLVTPGGHRMSVAMASFGDYGWVSDRSGYRYTPVQPENGQPWPVMPDVFRSLVEEATEAAGFPHPPLQAGLLNLYRPGTRLSLHQDKDEEDAEIPIVSVSLGVAATFLWGGLDRAAPVRRFRLSHGDVVVWGGPSRMMFHGVAPLAVSSHPLTGECRLNMTFRQVTRRS
ncbi:DNA repair protein [Acetobacter aceti NRIC 0242]|uniref:Alpha-ketoglutarate-dependent dioxygenase AlkB n=1 Tax=Acetobacter aceti NBRC 14818 TaxID=887700 RepID=A0AB33ID04_ACEAC|nr:DNA oxidative demethylase AlkB [Acetobacter aceti]TCS34235.1 DNA-N1-methyladenine dioxygenase [Acetobacter aceti NBRC 14818]BCK75479.1 alpha-ketoglutarate-dependent dioxygenase AlkB [Acetobacter aceti NBRC 14818]GAN58732.1 DNA repair protein for alkylated DNA AlkB [Acetobacter aceti NBRC 14818]GBO81319.1 DNA repair protein [Acetobacter aceti NRIC 0242]